MAGLSCHRAIDKLKGETDITVALAGNPNVGKSSVFNRLTGMGVVTANYPGKTVEINIASTRMDGKHIGIVDLPGTYALGAISEDQWVARRGLLDGRPDVVVVILDATNLARNLYLALQILELEMPVVIALNLIDQATRQGLALDAGLLAQEMGVPVVETVATRGEGLDELMRVAVEKAEETPHRSTHVRFGRDIEKHVTELTERIITAELPSIRGLSERSLAILLLESDEEFQQLVDDAGGEQVLREAARQRQRIEDEHGEPAGTRIARERHGTAGNIADEVREGVVEHLTMSERIWRMTTAPATGLPILAAVLIVVFALLFWIGGWLATGFSFVWQHTASPVIQAVVDATVGEGLVGTILLWGFDAGIEAALAVGIPYVLTFYLLFSMLEDTGYLNSVAFLADRAMHRLGLHGRAVIPLVAGGGCNVPAIIGTRVLSTMRERVIASTLIALVPCSARTAVIMGSLSGIAGPWPALGVFFVSGLVIVTVGLLLNKMMPGESTGLVMEMFPFRVPNPPTVFKKTWFRFKDFIYIAVPIVLVGSIVLGTLYETGAIWALAAPMAPIIEGWLGLPAVAGLTLLFAVLRKELALQLLTTLAVVEYGQGAQSLNYFMTNTQLFVYALVNTIYIPCIATIAILGRELNWKRTALIVAGTITIAIIVGGLARIVLDYTGWLG